ncbi:MAG: hypothetical protein QW356_06770 [Candidatus Hadarchaeales archaeon]
MPELFEVYGLMLSLDDNGIREIKFRREKDGDYELLSTHTPAIFRIVTTGVARISNVKEAKLLTPEERVKAARKTGEKIRPKMLLPFGEVEIIPQEVLRCTYGTTVVKEIERRRFPPTFKLVTTEREREVLYLVCCEPSRADQGNGAMGRKTMGERTLSKLTLIFSSRKVELYKEDEWHAFVKVKVVDFAVKGRRIEVSNVHPCVRGEYPIQLPDGIYARGAPKVSIEFEKPMLWVVKEMALYKGGRRYPTLICRPAYPLPEEEYEMGVFGSKSLEDSVWEIQTVDPVGGLSHTSIALDPSGRPHMSYRGANCLKYAHWNGSSWEIYTIDPIAGDSFYENPMALDSSGRPHISYFDSTNKCLKYAHWNGSSWEIQTVEHVEDGRYTSIALDSSGRPHISYFDFRNNRLKYAHWNGSFWEIQTVGVKELGNVFHIFIVPDPPRKLHIVYGVYGSIKYGYWNGDSWKTQTVDSVIGYPCFSMALDSSGRPHISYYTRSQIKYACWNGRSWDIQKVDPRSYMVFPISIVLDFSGRPHISYCASTSGCLKYAYRNKGQWKIRVVEYGGGFNSMAVDSSGKPHLSYFDTYHHLKYAHWIGTFPPP